MRILLAHSYYRVTGGEDQYVDQLRNLLAGSHDVQLFAKQNWELGHGPTVAARMTWSNRILKEATGRIRSFHPDVIHVHNAYPGLGAAVHHAAQRESVPVIMTVHNFRLRCPNGLMFTEGSTCDRCIGGNYANAVLHECFPDRKQATAYAMALWLHRFIGRLESKIKFFIAPSVFMKQRLMQWGIAGSRISVVRPFTDLGARAASVPGVAGIYVGRLSLEKGIDVLVEALHAAGDPPFWIVGTGPEETRIRQRIGDFGLKRTRLFGHVNREQLENLLVRARYLVLPSLVEENAPLAAIEGMALGKPLVVSDVGGLPELAQDGRGLVCRSGSMDSLSEGINRMEANGDYREKARIKCRAFVEEGCSREGHLASLEAVYEKCRQR